MAERRKFPSGQQDQYMLRFPDGMRERLKESAAANNRSLNAEIIARLELTFEHLFEYNAAGAGALVRRLEAGIEGSELLAQRLAAELRAAAGVVSKDDAPIRAAIEAYAEEQQVNLPVATQAILKDWLIGHGYLPHSEDPEGAN